MLQATLLHETWEEMNIVNAKNKELMSRNVKLEWDATAAEELRQSQLLTLSGTPDVNASLVSMGLEGNKVAEDAVQREHVIDVLRTEVQAFKIKISTLQVRTFSSLDNACAVVVHPWPVTAGC